MVADRGDRSDLLVGEQNTERVVGTHLLRMSPGLRSIVMSTVMVALAAPARAQVDVVEAGSVRPPTALDWLAVPAAGTAVARLSLEAELRHGHALQPLTLAPDVEVGLDGRFALLIATSRAAEMRL